MEKMVRTLEDYFLDRKIFVTGATGLVGSWLVKDLISKKADVTCLVRDFVPNSLFFSEKLNEKVTIAHGDLADFSCIERIINEYESEIVIHLGAQAIVGLSNNSPLGTFESNIKGTWNVLEACRLHDKSVKSIVVASSDKAYGTAQKLPYTEETALAGEHPYDVSKSCTDLLAQCFGKTYNLPVSISRCGNFFGGGDLNFSRIVPSTIKSAYLNKTKEIRSDGSYVRDYIYVKDAMSAYLHLARKTPELNLHGEAFNFSNEIQLTVLELVRKILKLMKKENLQLKIMNKAANEIKKQHLSAKKARDVLGWSSEWEIDRGLAETISWYENYFDKKYGKRGRP